MHDGLFIGTTLLELVLLHCYFAVLFYAPDKSKRVIGINYAAAGGMLFFSSVSFFPPLVTGLLSIGSAFLVSLLYPARMKTRRFFRVVPPPWFHRGTAVILFHISVPEFER
ncbi:hypothetical protein P7H21_01495 [Paenibacillus larvae]|nr:hypothetical protein [Paenibacillus larvae]MDT2302980.1 hypothetical protein [Paenibacillus larvae]